jgi:hypothetical protein
MILLDWTPQQLDTLRAESFHRFITTSARVRGMAIEDYHRTTALAPIKPPPEVVTGEYMPPGTCHRPIYGSFRVVPETRYATHPDYQFNNDPSTCYRYR